MHKLRVSIDQRDFSTTVRFLFIHGLSVEAIACAALGRNCWELGPWWYGFSWYWRLREKQVKMMQLNAVRLVVVARGKSAIFEPPLVRIGGASPWNPLGVTFLGGWLGWMLETPGGWNERRPKDSNTKLWNMSIQWLIPGLNHWLTILIYFESCSMEYL